MLSIRRHPTSSRWPTPTPRAWAVLQAGQWLGVPALAFCHSSLSALAVRLVGGEQGLGTRHGLWAQAYLVDLYAGFDLVLAPSRGMARRLQQWGLRHLQLQGWSHVRAHDGNRLVEQMMRCCQGVLQHGAYQRQASRAALPRNVTARCRRRVWRATTDARCAPVVATATATPSRPCYGRASARPAQ